MLDLKNLLNTLNTVLFDMDGTLVNTEPLHAKAAIEVLADLGIKIDLMSCLEKYYGMTDTSILKIECPGMSEKEIAQTINKKNIVLIELLKNLNQNDKSKLTTPGLFEFLSYLKKKEYKLAVVSASEDVVVHETLKAFEISPFMNIQLGRGQTTKTKPDPAPYEYAMKLLSTTPNNSIIFEDSPTGLASAKGSHAQVVRITEFTHDNKKSEFFEIKNFLNII